MSSKTKSHLIVAGSAIVAGVILAIAKALTGAGSITWSSSFWTPILLSALTVGGKIAVESFISGGTNTIQQ